MQAGYHGDAPAEDADDAGHAAAGRVQDAVGGALEEQHAGQVEHQRRLLRLLQLLHQRVAVDKQGLSGGGGGRGREGGVVINYLGRYVCD